MFWSRSKKLTASVWETYWNSTGNVLDYLYHQKYWELIGIDLSRQASRSIPQQILNFSLNSLYLTE